MLDDLNAIIQFIQQKDTDYAYMLTGAWGSGKTFFWKHIVESWLKEHATKGDLVAYVSLYGIKKSDQVRSALLTQLHPRLSKAGRIASSLAPALVEGFGLPSPDVGTLSNAFEGMLEWLGKGKRLIICFDDLERTSMPIHLALGQINQFVEHAGAKVIILCNEDEIPKKQREHYYKTKEKVVRITRIFSTNPAEVLSALIAEFEPDRPYHTYLTENRGTILETLRRSKLKNLRSLKYALLLCQLAFDALTAVIPEEVEALKGYMEMLFPTVLELQERRITAHDAQAFLTQGEGAIFGAYLHNKKGEKTKPLAEFGERYEFGSFSRKLPVSEALAELVESGYLNRDTFRAEIEERRKERSDGQQAIDALLGGWFTLPDENLDSTIAAALAAIRDGEVKQLERMYNLANTLGWMAKEGVSGIAGGPATEAFDAGLEKLSKAWQPGDREVFMLEHSPHHGETETELGSYVRTRIGQIHARACADKLRERFKAAFDAMDDDPDLLAHFLSDEDQNGIGREPLGSFITAAEMTSAFFSGSNHIRSSLAMSFRHRYARQRVEVLLNDLGWLEEFKRTVTAEQARVGDKFPVRNYNLQRLLKAVNDAISAIKQLQSAKAEAVPPQVQQHIAAQYKPKAEEE